MKVLKKIKIGSSAFFGNKEGFNPKDVDWLCLVDNYIRFGKPSRVLLKNNDIIMYHKDTLKEDFIKEALQSNLPMKIGKFIVPEFIECFGVTIEDLLSLKELIDKLDDKHCYEKIIYDTYINQGTFELKEDTLDKAFKEYIRYRQ